MARAVEDSADLALLTTDNPRSEDPQAIINDVRHGFGAQFDVEVVIDRAEAIGRALAEARPGDCVLIAGKGHEKHQIIGNRRVHFDDCEIAQDWLYEQQAEGSRQQAAGSRQ